MGSLVIALAQKRQCFGQHCLPVPNTRHRHLSPLSTHITRLFRNLSSRILISFGLLRYIAQRMNDIVRFVVDQFDQCRYIDNDYNFPLRHYYVTDRAASIPSWAVEPSLPSEGVTQGSSQNLTCAADGEPAPEVAWYEGAFDPSAPPPSNQQPIQSGVSESVLVLENIQVDADYTCFVSNEYGVLQSLVEVRLPSTGGDGGSNGEICLHATISILYHVQV